jgi:hypothetical protein
MNKLLAWLENHEPIMCVHCSKFVFRKDAIYEATSTGLELPLCKPCHDILFTPFSTQEEVK